MSADRNTREQFRRLCSILQSANAKKSEISIARRGHSITTWTRGGWGPEEIPKGGHVTNGRKYVKCPFCPLEGVGSK